MPEDVTATADETAMDGTARADVQLFLGQLEGLLHRVIVVDGREPVGVSEEDWTLLAEAFREGREQFGLAQHSLNTGDFDEALAEAAMTGRQGKLKFGGWFRRLRDF